MKKTSKIQWIIVLPDENNNKKQYLMSHSSAETLRTTFLIEKAQIFKSSRGTLAAVNRALRFNPRAHSVEAGTEWVKEATRRIAAVSNI